MKSDARDNSYIFAQRTEKCLQAINSCNNCKKDLEIESRITCIACKSVFYCSVEHQRQDWGRHKRECDNLHKNRLEKSIYHLKKEAAELSKMSNGKLIQLTTMKLSGQSLNDKKEIDKEQFNINSPIKTKLDAKELRAFCKEVNEEKIRKAALSQLLDKKQTVADGATSEQLTKQLGELCNAEAKIETKLYNKQEELEKVNARIESNKKLSKLKDKKKTLEERLEQLKATSSERENPYSPEIKEDGLKKFCSSSLQSNKEEKEQVARELEKVIKSIEFKKKIKM